MTFYQAIHEHDDLLCLTEQNPTHHVRMQISLVIYQLMLRPFLANTMPSPHYISIMIQNSTGKRRKINATFCYN